MKNVKKPGLLSKILKGIAWIFVAQLILLNISAALHAHKLTHFYQSTGKDTVLNSSTNIFSKTWKLFAGPRFFKSAVTTSPPFKVETIQLKTKSQLSIEAWYSVIDSSKGIVILFHGISTNKSYLIAEASEFRNSGFNVMLVDIRAHGNSAGNNCSTGFFESEEVKLAYDYALSRDNKKIFLYGVSMGAVIIMKAVHDYAIKPEGVILEMPFASLQDHMKARARNLGFPEQPFAMLVTFWSGLERGFNGYKHSTKGYAEKVHCRVLLQWGALDKYVLKSETDQIFKKMASTDKKLVMYKNAGHESLLHNEPHKWKKEMNEFLE